jgi:hypothetical protein
MRRQDKYKNMMKANLMMEQSYLSGKGLLKEESKDEKINRLNLFLDKFKNLNPIESNIGSMLTVEYVDENGEWWFYHSKNVDPYDGMGRPVIIRYKGFWEELEKNFGYNDQAIEDILTDWLEDNYDFRDIIASPGPNPSWT